MIHTQGAEIFDGARYNSFARRRDQAQASQLPCTSPCQLVTAPALGLQLRWPTMLFVNPGPGMHSVFLPKLSQSGLPTSSLAIAIMPVTMQDSVAKSIVARPSEVGARGAHAQSVCRHKETRKVCSGDPRRRDRQESRSTFTWYCQEDAVPLTGVEGDYVAPAARDTYFQNEPNLIAPFDFDYVPWNLMHQIVQVHQSHSLFSARITSPPPKGLLIRPHKMSSQVTVADVRLR